MNETKPEGVELSVIRAEDLKPGDIVLIHHDETRCKVTEKQIAKWAERFFARTGVKHVVVPRGIRLVQDSMNIQIDRLRTTERRIILKGPHSDIIDAVIYAFKESPAYANECQLPRSKKKDSWSKAHLVPREL